MHKFLHLSDIHLDSPIFCRSESLREKLYNELCKGFEKAIDCAISERVGAVLLAGDVLDAQNLSMSTENFLCEQFERLNEAHIPVIYTAGQSDPADHLERILGRPWPPNVIHIKGSSPKVIELQDVDETPIARIVGVGCEKGQEVEKLIASLPPVKEDIPYIGVMYSRIRSAMGIEGEKDQGEVIDFDVKFLRAVGYSYWALGHAHQHQRLNGLANAWYSGNFMGRNPDEPGLKGGLLVTLKPENAIEVEFKRFSSVEWFDLVLTDLEKVTDVDGIFRQAELVFDQHQDDQETATHQLVRFTLKGVCPLAEELQLETRRAVLEEKLAAHLNVDDVEIKIHHLTPVVNPEAYIDEPHLLSEALRVIEVAKDDPAFLIELVPEEVARNMRAADREHYISTLLSGLDREAVIRLTREDPHAY